jgi:hypothetical protein
VSDLRQTTERLHEIATELGDESLTDERAEELAREAAELVGEASNDLDRALRESSSDQG